MAARRAIVIGAGIAGLSAAIALRKADYAVTVLEQAETLRPLGAALSLWGNAMAALDWLGAADAIVQDAAPIRALNACSARGRSILSVDLARAYAAGQLQPRLPTRALLQSSLLGAATGIDIRFGQIVTRVDRSDSSVSVSCASGGSESADIAIVADGINSETATAVLGTRPKHARYGGVLALSDDAPGACIDGEASEYWGRGERFGLLDLGQQRTYWFFMRNEASPAESAALTLADIERRLSAWPAGVAVAVHATPSDWLIPFSVHAKPSPTRLGQGRIICVGDAAHAMEPNLGQGGCQALEDAVALGIAAQVRSPGAILPLFEAMRLRRARQFVKLSRDAGVLAQSRSHMTIGVARTMASAIPDRLSEWRVGNLHRLPDYAAVDVQ